jgi:hypothetical protein
MANEASAKKAAKAAKKAEYMRLTTEGIKAGKVTATARTNNNAEQEPKPAASPDVDEEGFKVVEKSKKTTPVEEAKATSKPAFDASALSPSTITQCSKKRPNERKR